MTIRLTQGAATWDCVYSVDGGSGAILPVRLSQFTAKLSQGKVQLHWRTEQELNNGWFIIERSADGRSFSSLASITGNGTISTASDYYYTDQTPLKGVGFYRLKQIDLDGRTDYSITRRIDNRQAGIQVSGVYPNPVQTEVNLSIVADRYFLINVVVYDATGKKFYTEKKIVRPGAQNLHIELPQLQAGIYELILQGDNMSTLSEKIVVM